MNKVIITTLILCTGILVAGCEKTYSVKDLKKDEKLLQEWIVRCGFTGSSKNCQNARLADHELATERRKKAQEERRQYLEELEKKRKEDEAKRKAEYEKRRAQQKRDYNFDP
ncbi:EexN family lipoprotein [Bartonella bilalgolemii]|uniref:EexN family lipoprotein n=1 Tax=Bartonella bilalgolemii TaxID=2942911 RepID=A0ABT0PCH4_9HYPH|nr:EexN family lipoprotein [Bartonella sp. G70]MCL6230294.1 EexN family lipoprotein [Bartonella sp. G70]